MNQTRINADVHLDSYLTTRRLYDGDRYLAGYAVIEKRFCEIHNFVSPTFRILHFLTGTSDWLIDGALFRFGERLNQELLYDIFGETHEGHDIYTDYPAYFLSGYRDCCSAADLTDEGQVRSVLEGTKIRWLMLPEVMPNDTDPSKALIEQCIDGGICELRRCSDGYYKSYCLYEVKR